MMSRLLLIDDHPVVQIGMKFFIENNKLFKEHDIAGTGREAVHYCQLAAKKKSHYDLIIMDINLPDYEIISLVKKVRHYVPETPVLMFSMEPPKLYVKRLIELGVSGFVDKTAPDEELLFAIRSILNGRGYFSSDVLMEAIGDNGQPAEEHSVHKLSDRESEILSLMVKGKNTQEISDILGLHKSSIATYRSRVFQKIGVSSNFDLYKWALKEGLIFP